MKRFTPPLLATAVLMVLAACVTSPVPSRINSTEAIQKVEVTPAAMRRIIQTSAVPINFVSDVEMNNIIGKHWNADSLGKLSSSSLAKASQCEAIERITKIAVFIDKCQDELAINEIEIDSTNSGSEIWTIVACGIRKWRITPDSGYTTATQLE